MRGTLLGWIAIGLAACRAPVELTATPPLPGLEHLRQLPAWADSVGRALASDSLAGRLTASPGQHKAAQLLARRLREMGLAGAADDGSYFQRFVVRIRELDTARTYLLLHSERDSLRLAVGRYFYALNAYALPGRWDTMRVLFGGYGISLPEYNDLAELKPEGRLLVVFSGAPRALQKRRIGFFQDSLDVDGVEYKLLNALFVHRAAGLIVLEEPDLVDDWERIRPNLLGPAMQLAQGGPALELDRPLLFAHPGLGRMLFGRAYDSLRLAALRGDHLTAGELPVRLSVRLSLSVRLDTTENVLAYVPGARRARQWVTLGAHYDHMGTFEGNIYRGADDNASGSVALLTVARALAEDWRAGRGPERSVLLVWYSGEEQGLLGSEWLVSNLPRRIGSIRNVWANLNVDMVGRLSADTLYAIGAGRLRPTLQRLLEEVNSRLGLFVLDYTFDDPAHPKRLYERSDHYAWVQRGVPAVFFTDGMGENWTWNTALDDYHRPTDSWEKINQEKLRRTALLLYALTRSIADRPGRL
ncbi:MAG: M28 family peptidase [Bacteroidetes bacterium]|nr:M28 family peptidase [Bacteroidota bacterium]